MAVDVVLVAATALHAGFQLVVTALVYPAFAETPVGEWPARHAAHSRRITPVVGLVYGWLFVAVILAVTDGLSAWRGVAVAASAVAVLATAFCAAPAHGRLGRGWDARAVRRLLVADRVRLAAALVAASAALIAAL